MPGSCHFSATSQCSSPAVVRQCHDELRQHDTSLRSHQKKHKKQKRNNNNHCENSIKIKLGASDKFMEIKVLCKSDACLAMCQITRGLLRYIAFKLTASENSAATLGPKYNIAQKSEARAAYIWCGFHIAPKQRLLK